MKVNQKGFGLPGILLVIVLLSVIGAVGRAVYLNRGKEDAPKHAEITNFEQCKAAGNPIMESYPEQCSANGKTYANTSQSTQELNLDDWMTYEIPNKAFTIKLPDGWSLKRRDANDLYGLSFEDLAYKPGTRAKISAIDDVELSQIKFWLGFNNGSPSSPPENAEKQQSLRTNDGVEIEKLIIDYEKRPRDDIQDNAIATYKYKIKTPTGSEVEALYTHYKKKTSHIELIEEMLKTLSFKG